MALISFLNSFHNYFIVFYFCIRFIDIADTNTGISPLHVAIQAENMDTIKALIEKKANLECVDNEANSVLHYAASTNTDIIMVCI